MRSSDTLKVYKKLLEKSEKDKKMLKRQISCPHLHWCTRCSHCRKILDSDKREIKKQDTLSVNAIKI